MDELWLRRSACDADVALSGAIAFLEHAALSVNVFDLRLADAKTIVQRLSTTKWTLEEANRYAVNALRSGDGFDE